MNNIDPRMLKELLRMQLLSKMNVFPDSKGVSTSNEEEDTGFSDLLNDILAQGSNNSAVGTVEVPTVANKLFKPVSMNPVFTSASSYHLGKAAGNAKADDLDPLIQDASRRNNVQPSLVKAVIDAESSFNSQAVSHSGAKGLMQLMDTTGKSVGVNDPFDPVQNVQGGTKYLSSLLNKYDGNQGVAIAAYNAGSGRIDRLGIANDHDLAAKLDELPKETQKYIAKVMNLQRNYEG